ncbi:peptidase family M48-domain-containing protein, partial [Sparassis latifolia]
SRVVLTFIPVVFLKKMKFHRVLYHLEKVGSENQDKKDEVVRRIRHSTTLLKILILTPILLFWVTIMASLERTPLTGRWRLILLSPEEEDDIAMQLAGPGWYRAVGDILSQNGQPRPLPASDWRLSWVRNTLRQLEAVIPVLLHEEEAVPDWMECGPDDIPLPPPAEYPLRPRPRGSEYFRLVAELSCSRAVSPAPHAISGPPYSLIVVDEPESSNAFSYGFGPDGAGGVVVFSGFLDDVLSRNPPAAPAAVLPQERSWWAALFGSLFALNSPPPVHPVPTEEQTSELAILLAHELAHLILAHHIETLSSGSIIVPGVMSIVTDIVRTLLFPVTMLFGPFINDAMAGLGKLGSGEFTKVSEYCTSQHQEIEADIVSARLLAHAGFDPRHAVRFWEDRQETPKNAECSPAMAERWYMPDDPVDPVIPRHWRGATHPIHTVRVQRLKQELARWEKAREKARAARRTTHPQPPSQPQDEEGQGQLI